MDTGLYLQIVRRNPQVGWDTNVLPLPEITVTFNIPIAEGVRSDQGLNQFVILERLDTATSVPVTFVSWDPVYKTLVFSPTESLAADALYQVFIRRELPSSEGRHMRTDVSWVFQVNGAPIGSVVLLDPGDATAFNEPPALSWQGVTGPTGLVWYEVDLHRDWQFGLPLTWTTTVQASGSGGLFSVNIGTPLAGQQAYYWRVRAFTAGVTGDYSDTRAFYVGTAAQAAPDATLQFEPDSAFELVSLVPEEGTPHQLTWPRIEASFTRPLSGASVNDQTVQLWTLSVDGRLTVPTAQVPGVALSVAGSTLTAVPPDAPAQNTRYTVRLLPGILSSSGDVLAQEIDTYFTGAYFPLYGGTIAVRAELGGFINQVGDDEILFYLWRGSLAVNELMLTKVRRLRRYVTYNEIIQYVSPYGETWGMVRYAELYAALQLFERFYGDRVEESSKHAAISTFDYAVDAQSLSEIHKRMREMRLELEQVGATFLFAATVSRSVIPSSYFRPDGRFALDWSQVPRRKF